MLTKKQINDQKIKSADLYEQLETSLWSDAINCDATLESFKADGKKDYVEQFVLKAVEDICAAHKRTNVMSEAERNDLLSRIIRKKPNYSVYDIKKFANMLIECELGESLKAVDAASILEKLAVYDHLRSKQLSLMYNKQSDVAKSYAGRDEYMQITEEDWNRVISKITQPLTPIERQAIDKFRSLCRRFYGEVIAGTMSVSSYEKFVDRGWQPIAFELRHQPHYYELF